MFAMEEKDIQKTNSSEQKSEQAIKTNDVSQIDMTNFIEIDRLKLFFGDPIIINDKITLYQPTVGDIVEFGEKKFYSILYTLTCIPSDMKSELWDANHTDWQTVDDFELFITMTRMLTSEDTKLFLGDLDLSKMIPCSRQDNGQLVLYDEKHDILIDKLIYLKIVTYIREMFNIYPKVEKAKNKKTFQVMIDFDRMQKLNQRKNKDCNASMLLPLISSMLNSPGFKYKKNELREVGVCEFMDSVQRISTIVSTTALLHGMYSGMVDTSKINKNQFNWLRDLSEENKKHDGVMQIDNSKA